MKRISKFILAVLFLISCSSVWAKTGDVDVVKPKSKSTKTEKSKKKKKSKKAASTKTKVAKTSTNGMNDVTDQAQVSQQADESLKPNKK